MIKRFDTVEIDSQVTLFSALHGMSAVSGRHAHQSPQEGREKKR